MGSTESSGDQPKVKPGTSMRFLRRLEDKAIMLLGGAVLSLVCWMWSGLSAQITRLEEARNTNETRVTVVEGKIKGMEHWLEKIDMKLDKLLDGKR